MKLGKKELIIAIAFVVLFAILGITAVNATENDRQDLNTLLGNILSEETNTDSAENQNTEPLKDIEIVTSDNAKNNVVNNTPDKLANTGLNNTPWLIIAFCGVSVIFAYKKIKEYNAD